jgi:glycosyltransferase involved in cell wall biosynthesis
MTDRPLSILLAGPLPPPIGGASISFRSLTEALGQRTDVSVSVVNTVGVRGRGLDAIVPLARLVGDLRRGLREADVCVLHVATSALHSMGPLTAILTHGSRTPLVIRKFAGTGVGAFGSARGFLSRWTLRRASLYLAQTKHLVEEARGVGIDHVRWFPNSRPMPVLPADPGDSRLCRKFVYLGHVREGKGILEIIDAAERFGGDVSVDVYGPLTYDIDASAFEGLSRVHYRGVLETSEVPGRLAACDALLLPTRFATEGYPGAILEAYGAGLPVIVTELGAIPEIVDESTGLTIDPADADALYAAMRTLHDDPALCARLRAGVRAKRGEFSSEFWHERFVKLCRGVVETGGPIGVDGSGNAAAKPGNRDTPTERRNRDPQRNAAPEIRKRACPSR